MLEFDTRKSSSSDVFRTLHRADRSSVNDEEGSDSQDVERRERARGVADRIATVHGRKANLKRREPGPRGQEEGGRLPRGEALPQRKARGGFDEDVRAPVALGALRAVEGGATGSVKILGTGRFSARSPAAIGVEVLERGMPGTRLAPDELARLGQPDDEARDHDPSGKDRRQAPEFVMRPNHHLRV
jgi:hypothetical protein